MPAYLIVQEAVNDEAMFAEYRKAVLPTLQAHDGRFIVRGGAMTVLEGQWPMPRLVIVEFPSRAAAEAWYRSPEYQKILPLRTSSTSGNMIIVDGVAG